MSNDILKEYFTKVEKPLTKADFERRLIESLHKRIVRIERRKYITTILLGIVGVVATMALVIYFTPLEALQTAIPSIEIDIPPMGSMMILQLSIIMLLSLIWQYVSYECQLRKLKERIKRKV